MNEPQSPTPLTDAAEKAYNDFHIKVSELKDWSIESLASLDHRPDDGWTKSRQLERELQTNLERVKELEQLDTLLRKERQSALDEWSATKTKLDSLVKVAVELEAELKENNEALSLEYGFTVVSKALNQLATWRKANQD